MSTIKSSAENLTLNADGANNDVIIQSNGSTKAIVTGEGSVGIGVTPETILSTYPTVQIGYGGAIAANTTNPSRFSIAANSYINSSGNRAYIQTDEATEMWMNAGTYEFRVAASGNADSNITWTTGFEIRNDGKARAKNGLLFGTDTAAANALSDYEIGTWSPVLISSGTSPTYSAGSAGIGGYYVKVGRLVTVWFDINAVIANIGDGTAIISGLPFTPNSGVANGGYSTVQWRSSSGFDIANGIPLTGWVHSNNYIYPEQQQNGGNSPLTYLTGTKRFTGMIVYQAD